MSAAPILKGFKNVGRPLKSVNFKKAAAAVLSLLECNVQAGFYLICVICD